MQVSSASSIQPCDQPLRGFVEMAPAAMAMFDKDMRYLAASARWRTDHRLDGEVIGESHYELFPDMPERWKQVHRRALAGETLRAEKDSSWRSGSAQWVRWEVRPWRHTHGGIGGIIIFSEDITECVRAHEALRQSEARLRIALAAASAGVWERDLRTNKNVWSDELWRLYGLSTNSVEPSHEAWRQSVHPEDRDGVCRTVNEAVGKGAEVRVEWRVPDTDGSERWLFSRGGPLPDANGDVSRYGGVVIDITEHKRAQEAVSDSERRLKAIFDASMDAIVVIDGQATILSVNPEFQAQFGYTSDEAIGGNVKMLMPAAEAMKHDRLRAAYLRSGKAGIIGPRRRVEGRRKNGEIFPLELAVAQTKVAGKRLFIGFMHDLTEIENERRNVEAARAELRHVARLSDMGEVAAALAHEVSQPLTAILGIATAARRALQPGGDPYQARAIEVIETQAIRAADILKSLRGFIEKRESQRAPENLARLIQDAVALASVCVGGRPPKMVVKPPSDDRNVDVDRVQIQQVLVNFLRNATDAMGELADPEIVIETELARPGLVRVSVSDNGPGIDPGIAARLFTPFVTTKTFGMGVGLSLCKTIIQNHGGEIGCGANTPKGATFWFTLPIAERAKAAFDADAAARGAIN